MVKLLLRLARSKTFKKIMVVVAGIEILAVFILPIVIIILIIIRNG